MSTLLPLTEPQNALTVRQVAEMLKVNERTIYRMAATGELSAFKVASSWRIMGPDLARWIQEQKMLVREI